MKHYQFCIIMAAIHGVSLLGEETKFRISVIWVAFAVISIFAEWK